MEALQPYQGLIVFALGVAIAVIGLAIRAKLQEALIGKANVATVEALAIRMTAVENRMVGVEMALRYMPNAESFGRIEVALADQRGDMRAMTEKVDGLREMLEAQANRIDLIDEHLKGMK